MSDDLHRPRPYCDWHEDYGAVLWWPIPVQEPPYAGTPLDLGKSIAVEIAVGVAIRIDNVGGWPFDGIATSHLWWTFLPDAKRIEDQVPL